MLSLASAPGWAQAEPWDVQGRAAHLTCGPRPLLLTGDHQDLTVTGPCRYVRVAGRHNDISIDVVPGGTIDITGAHNDVTWHAAATPHLLDHGISNSFHGD